jgi:archaellum biogenesis ATPase FlaH
MFEIEKQKILIEQLLGSADLFARCNGILKPEYFDSSLQKSVGFIRNYFEEYREIPANYIVKAETNIEFEPKPCSKGEIKYASKEIEKFCRYSAVINAVWKAPSLHEKGDYDGIWQIIKEAAAVSLSADLGISYFDNVEGRLRDLLTNSPTMSTGWLEVDDAIGGGINKQELILLAGASGVGKSVTLSNLSINLIEQGYNGIYFSLELADRIVSKRFDSLTSGISQSEILTNIEKVAENVEKFKNSKNVGELFIKRLPESITTANHIRAYLKEFEQTYGYTPDFIIIDYIDLMATNKGVSQENIWLADKFKSEEVRAIGADFDLAVITASQIGRAGSSADKLEQGHIQGGYSKVQTADIMIGLLQSDQMRAAEEFMFEYLKTRNSGGVGTHTLLHWNPLTLRISNYNQGSQNLKLHSTGSKKTEVINTILGNQNLSNNTQKLSLLSTLNKKGV